MELGVGIKAAEPKEVARRLKWLRVRLGLKGYEMAEQLNITPARYSSWETGAQRVSIEGALSIGEKFGLTLDFIYLGRSGTLPVELMRAWSCWDKENL